MKKKNVWKEQQRWRVWFREMLMGRRMLGGFVLLRAGHIGLGLLQAIHSID